MQTVVMCDEWVVCDAVFPLGNRVGCGQRESVMQLRVVRVCVRLYTCLCRLIQVMLCVAREQEKDRISSVQSGLGAIMLSEKPADKTVEVRDGLGFADG